MSSAFSSACDYKSHFCKQCGLRSDCFSRSILIMVHTVCLYAKIGLKSLQEYSADDMNRQHFQMQVFLHFKGKKICVHVVKYHNNPKNLDKSLNKQCISRSDQDLHCYSFSSFRHINRKYPASILYKSIAGHYRFVSYTTLTTR